ncbi:hypothetical protein BS47DRAFT_856917 [Hydnum rufescens UP504]|uniref:Uncharacterized protein n=1 Tax=Hydnum rufescens UP504 TaxID=1448309 RepID=A0A9P6AZJ4_9AGAM|nr:hypothetical protein BS47DRAFT_856917 [Hydnum rufescens UP504]
MSSSTRVPSLKYMITHMICGGPCLISAWLFACTLSSVINWIEADRCPCGAYRADCGVDRLVLLVFPEALQVRWMIIRMIVCSPKCRRIIFCRLSSPSKSTANCPVWRVWHHQL